MNYRETSTTPGASRLTGVNKHRGHGLVELEKVVRLLPCHIRARSTDNVECEGPIVTVLIILITQIGLPFWGPYHILSYHTPIDMKFCTYVQASILYKIAIGNTKGCLIFFSAILNFVKNMFLLTPPTP